MPTRIVTGTCEAGHLSAWPVDLNASGPGIKRCDECGMKVGVNLDRSEKWIRAGSQTYTNERARSSRLILSTLVPAVEAYLKLHDMEVKELPEASPLRIAMLAARDELAHREPST